jgi:hypothetical protein
VSVARAGRLPLIASLAVLLAAAAAHAAPRGPAARALTCSGTHALPGVLAGVYPHDVHVKGTCDVDAGRATVHGELLVLPGGTLVAAYAIDDRSHRGTSSLTVDGSLRVERGAAAILGCEPGHLVCLDDPNQASPTLSSEVRIKGSLRARQAQGVVVHDAVVLGSVTQIGGGGGLVCQPTGIFTALQDPVYSDYEDITIRGSLTISGLSSCWLGVARVKVGGSLDVLSDQLADPDAIEILSNTIAGNLACSQDSHVWDSSDVYSSVYPRVDDPNTVHGRRSGQCVLVSPTAEGGGLGPGPF